MPIFVVVAPFVSSVSKSRWYAKVCRASKWAKNHFVLHLFVTNANEYFHVMKDFSTSLSVVDGFYLRVFLILFVCARKQNSQFDADSYPRSVCVCVNVDTKNKHREQRSKKYNNERKRFLYVSHLDDRSTLSAEWKSVCTMFIGAAQSLISPDRWKHYCRHIFSYAMFTVLVTINHLIHRWKRGFSDIAFNANHNQL